VTAVNIALPLLGIGIGALITYVLNVRTRRTSYVEDLFNQAIAEVAAAEASINYTSSVARPANLSDQAWAELEAWFATEGLKTWWTKQQAANQALARVRPYRSEITHLLPLRLDFSHPDASSVIEVLRQGPERRANRRKPE
jgi:hypothetical protein